MESFSPIPKTGLRFSFIIIASTNDHWATKERTTSFAEDLGSKSFLIDNTGHINGASGYGNWNEGLDLLKNEFINLE